MALTPTQQALALSAYAQGMGPLALAKAMSLDYSDVYLFLQNAKKEAFRRGFDPIPTLGAPFDLSSNGGLVSSNGSIIITPSGLNVNLATGTVIPIIQARLDVVDSIITHSITTRAQGDQLFAVSIFLESEGDGLISDKLIGTLTFGDASSPDEQHTIQCFLFGGPGENVVMETYPVLVEGGSDITFSTAFVSNPFTYDLSVRMVQMP
jgi:hypothetical protein